MTISESPLSNADDEWSERLVRYWTGEATPDETIQIERWFESHPERREQNAKLSHSLFAGEWTSLTDRAIGDRTDRIIERTRRVSVQGTNTQSVPALRSSETTVPATQRPVRRLVSWGTETIRTFLIGAASAVVLLIVGYQWTHRSSVDGTGIPNGGYVTAYTTAPGERATVTLPDGSTVVLNVSSQLRVPMDYGKKDRALHLTGEALFTTAHHNSTPFSVTTTNGTTRVLGTTFVVRQYHTDTATTVAVRDGKVSAANVVLVAGQEIQVRKNIASSIHVADANRWNFVNNVLVIADQSLPDAIPELSRWYDADIRIDDPALMHRRITGTFEAGSMTDLMWILETGFNVRVVRTGRTLSLSPKR